MFSISMLIQGLQPKVKTQSLQGKETNRFDFWRKSILDGALFEVWKPMDQFQNLCEEIP